MERPNEKIIMGKLSKSPHPLSLERKQMRRMRVVLIRNQNGRSSPCVAGSSAGAAGVSCLEAGREAGAE